MRVMSTYMRARSDPDGERGAVAVIFVISLIAIMAIAVLTIDAGNLFFKRRAMVNGADAAALAAAQACARMADTADPETVADTNATMNVSGLTAWDGGIITKPVGCDVSPSGRVTVEYTKTEQNFFAQVLGFGNTTDVYATATAVWGTAAGANSPLPVVLNLGTLQGPCEIPYVPIGTVCYLWYDNDRFTPSNFGFMSLSQWNVASTDNCDHAGGANDLQSWIDGSWTGPPLTLNDPPDLTYVCSLTGGTSGAWAQAMGNIVADPVLLNHIKFFPVNDESGQVMNGPQIDKFDIVGFAALSVDGVWKANKAPAACGSVPNSSAYCLEVSWQGYQFGQGVCCGGLDLGTREVRLCDPVLATCP